jgi:hypothetical protein
MRKPVPHGFALFRDTKAGLPSKKRRKNQSEILRHSHIPSYGKKTTKLLGLTLEVGWGSCVCEIGNKTKVVFIIFPERGMESLFFDFFHSIRSRLFLLVVTSCVNGYFAPSLVNTWHRV